VISTCRATRAERREPLPGDALIADPLLSATHAIDVAAPPERVWPWLAQMGAGRGGWYSWDRIDNGGAPSAERIVPELQRIRPGDVLPAEPGLQDAFVVARAEPPRALLLLWPAPGGGQRGTWEFALRRAALGTRLVVRGRLSEAALGAAADPPVTGEPIGKRIERVILRLPRPLLRGWGALVHRIMEVRQLRGIKRRAEGGAAPAAWRRWGATDDEVVRRMAGDDLVPDPVYGSTHAIEVRARPEEIWPWLAQMGKGRGGLYSIDLLDRLFGILDAPSADRILLQWQDLRPGDVIPIGRSPGWPVHAVDPPRSLVLRIEQAGALVTQSWSIDPVDAETTRLVLRVRGAMPAGIRTRAFLAALAPQVRIMVGAQLRGIRRRAEGLARLRRGGFARAR
jgi:hypothetical protein